MESSKDVFIFNIAPYEQTAADARFNHNNVFIRYSSRHNGHHEGVLLRAKKIASDIGSFRKRKFEKVRQRVLEDFCADFIPQIERVSMAGINYSRGCFEPDVAVLISGRSDLNGEVGSELRFPKRLLMTNASDYFRRVDFHGIGDALHSSGRPTSFGKGSAHIVSLRLAVRGGVGNGFAGLLPKPISEPSQDAGRDGENTREDGGGIAPHVHPKDFWIEVVFVGCCLGAMICWGLENHAKRVEKRRRERRGK